MLLRPTNEDFRTVAYYIGRLTVALGIVLIVPLITALLFKEWDRAIDFFLSMQLAIFLGLLPQKFFLSHRDMNWSQGLAVTSISWLVAMLIGAIPLALSGHYASYLDACFDAMSGFATAGLSLIQNLDHAAYSINMWRHLMMFLGGQGIVLIGLTFFMRGTAGAYRMYVGEAREEKVLPNVIHTSRFIWIAIFRKGFYQLISAHTGTGFMNIYPQQFSLEWGHLALLMVIIAMGFGGSACSTAGGIKALRIGIFCKSLIQDIRRIMVPGSAIIISKFHHIKDVFLEDRLVRSSFLILILYIITYFAGTIVGLFYGYPFYQAFFESTSAAANVGLSTGITNPSMPTGLKVTYIIQMWMGRLEFMSVFILLGVVFARLTGARGRSK